jgi:hypothetical protein
MNMTYTYCLLTGPQLPLDPKMLLFFEATVPNIPQTQEIHVRAFLMARCVLDLSRVDSGHPFHMGYPLAKSHPERRYLP